MAAPTGIVWGNIVTGSKSTRKGRIGIYKGVTETATQVKVNIQVWFWSMYNLTDENNSYYYNTASTATTLIGSVYIKHTVSSGEGWSTSNQTKLGEANYTYNKGTSSSTNYYSAKLTDVDSVGGSNVMSVSTSYTVPALASYTITYNANGGTGAPGKQTKWYGKNITIYSTKPTRTGYSFLGWATSSTATAKNDAYDPGDTYTGNANITLYAVWKANTFTVSYNANGGTGAPSNQIKTYGVNLTLSSVIPTRVNYTFQGWAISSSGGVTYLPGSTYADNNALNLYAVWSLSYVKPRLFNLYVERSDSYGNPKDDGQYAFIEFDWRTDIADVSLIIEWKAQTETEWHTYVTFAKTSLSGHIEYVITGTKFNTELSYDIRVSVRDTNDITSSIVCLVGTNRIIDILAEGKGIAFNKPAELEGVFDCDFDAKFNKPVYGKVLGLDTLPRIEGGSDFNDYIDTGCFAVYTNADAKNIVNIPVPVAGRLIVFDSTGSKIIGESWAYLRQKFVPFSLEYGVWERDVTRDDSNSWTYNEWMSTSTTKVILFEGSSPETIPLTKSVENFDYIEIFFTDNNGKKGGYTKIHYPYYNPVQLSIVEASGAFSTYIRRTSYTLSGTTMTPDLTTAAYTMLYNSKETHSAEPKNYIKITRVVGHYE